MSTERNHESIDGKTAMQLTQADTAVAETSSHFPEDPGSKVDSDKCSMDSSGDSMTTADTTSLTTTSLVDAEKMCNGIMSFVQAFKVDIFNLEMKNKKILESLSKAKRGENDAVKKLTEVKDKNIKLQESLEKAKRGEDDAVKKLKEVKDKNIKLQEQLDEMAQCGGARDFVALKGKFYDLEKKIVDILDNQAKKVQCFEDYKAKMEKRIIEILENQTEKNQHFDNLQAKMEKLQMEIQQKHQEIDPTKAQQALEIQCLTSDMGFMGLENLKDGYIFREKPLKTIPNGIIQVSRAKADESDDHESDGPPREDEDSRFLYVLRDQYKDFEKFTKIAELVFGFGTGHLKWLKGTKSDFLFCKLDINYDFDEAEVVNKWEKEASQKDRVYILSGEYPYNSDTVYYIEE